MPQLGETVTEGTITRWLKQVGDAVAEDEVLFEVSTDKVDSEVPSPAAGTVSEILVPEGETVDVGTRLAVISGGAPEPAAAAPPAGASTSTKTASTEAESAETASAETESAETASTGAASAQAASIASEQEAVPAASDAADGPEAPDPATETPAAGTAPAGRSPARGGGSGTRPADDRPPARPGDGGNAAGGGKVLSPVVRRLIAEYDLEPSAIEGSGAGGRITRSDVLAVIDQRGANGNGASARRDAPAASPGAPSGRPPSASPAPAAPVAPGVESPAVKAIPPARAGERDTVVPFTNIRRRTAEHMVRSKHTSAHTMVAVEVDYAGVDRVRLSEKAAFKAAEGFSLTYLPFISRATVDAIEAFPHVNSSVGDDELIVHNDLNLGIAVDLDFEGLLVPVIHQADGLRLRALARDISDLARKARSRQLTMDDIAGGTFTITNAGPFGTLITVPVINQPQVAILSTDGVRKRPVVVELPDGSDSIAIHPVGNLVMSWDHRAFDGAYAAAFLARVKDIIESRDWSEEL